MLFASIYWNISRLKDHNLTKYLVIIRLDAFHVQDLFLNPRPGVYFFFFLVFATRRWINDSKMNYTADAWECFVFRLSWKWLMLSQFILPRFGNYYCYSSQRYWLINVAFSFPFATIERNYFWFCSSFLSAGGNGDVSTTINSQVFIFLGDSGTHINSSSIFGLYSPLRFYQ